MGQQQVGSMMGSPPAGATTPGWTMFFLAFVSMLAVAEAPNGKPNASLRSRKIACNGSVAS